MDAALSRSEGKQPAEGCPEGGSEAKATGAPQSTPQARKALPSCVILSAGECRKTDAYNGGAPPTLAETVQINSAKGV